MPVPDDAASVAGGSFAATSARYDEWSRKEKGPRKIAQAQIGEQRLVARRALAVEVTKQPPPSADKLK